MTGKRPLAELCRFAVLAALVSIVGMFNLGCSSDDDDNEVPPPVTQTTYNIVGEVFGEYEGDISLTLSGASEETIQLGPAGGYAFGDLTDGSYTITPELEGYSFDPPTAEVAVDGEDVFDINFTVELVVVPSTYTLSGTITGAKVDTVTLTITETGATATSAADGTYSFPGLAAGEYTVTPTLADHYFTSDSQIVTLSGDRDDIDFNSVAAGTPTYGITGMVTGATLADVEITLSNAGTGATVDTTSTSAAGTYSFARILNGTYNVTAAKEGFNFTTAAVTVADDNATADDIVATAIAVPSDLTITGITTDDGFPDDGITSDKSLIVSGTALVGTEVSLYISSAKHEVEEGFVAVATADADGNWSVNILTTLRDADPALPWGPQVSLGGEVNGKLLTGDYTFKAVAGELSDTFEILIISQGKSQIGGTITDDSDPAKPLAGVSLVIANATGSVTLVTSDTGAYLLGGFPEGTYTVTPSLLGYGFTPVAQEVELAGESKTGVDFVGAEGEAYTISGRVVTDTVPAEGLDGVTVTLSLTDGTIVGIPATTDADGNYGFTVFNSTYNVTAAKEGFKLTTPAEVTVADADDAFEDIVATAIPTSFSISGTVTLDGVALGNVVVAVESGESDTTDDQGAYTIEGLVAGDYNLTATLATYSFSQPATVSIGSENVVDIDITATAVPTSFSISGTITDADEGLEVTLSGVGIDTKTTTIDGDGYYEFIDLVDGTYTVSPSKDAYTYLEDDQEVPVSGGDVPNINFTATAIPVTYSISGKVETPDGEGGVKGVEGVTIEALLSGADEPLTAETAADGTYSIDEGLVPGSYRVTASGLKDIYESYSDPEDVTLADVDGERDAEDVDFTATAISYVITGVVTKVDGTTLFPDVTITVSYAEEGGGPIKSVTTTTGLKGEYSFKTGLVADRVYTVTANLTGHAFPTKPPVVLEPADATDTVDFTEIPSFSISGTVTDSAGDPLVGVNVVATLGDGDAAFASATTDGAGFYTFGGFVEANTYTVTPKKLGYTFEKTKEVIPMPGANVADTDFTGTRVYTISGVVSVEGSEPVEYLVGVEVTLTDGAGDPVGTPKETDANGEYVFTDLRAGEYTVTPTTEGYDFDPVSMSVTVSAAVGNRTADFTATKKTYTISGEVPVEGGMLEGALITLKLGDEVVRDVRTLADGLFEFEGLENGTYTLTPSLAGYSFNPESETLEVADGDVPPIALTAFEHKISGTITDASGGLAGVDVKLTPFEGDEETVNTAVDGTYSFSGMAGGDAVVTPSLDGYTFDPVSRTVSVGEMPQTDINFTATPATGEFTVLYRDGFENGFGPGTEEEPAYFVDGGLDCLLLTDSVHATEGTNYLELRDGRDEPTASAQLANDFDATEYGVIEVSFDFVPVSMDLANADDIADSFAVEYKDASGWQIAKRFAREAIDGFDVHLIENNIVQPVTVTIEGEFTAACNIRFRCIGNSNRDQVFIDNVVISAK